MVSRRHIKIDTTPVDPAVIHAFQETVWGYYAKHGRHDLPWRQPEHNGTFDPYKIMVSELMLQQTQVSRVIPKFQEFLAAFPTVQSLAQAPLNTVLIHWSGLGYNRRAKFLWQAAQAIVQNHHGQVPHEAQALVALPGIGANTAAAILAYAYNQPVVFVETNIRTVFIYHFFANEEQVSDAMLSPCISAAVPPDTPREWYWALMDYGTYLKQTVGNISRMSKAYAKQSRFEGSRRQIRGQVLRLLAAGPIHEQELTTQITDDRLPGVLHDLQTEALIEQCGSSYQLTGHDTIP